MVLADHALYNISREKHYDPRLVLVNYYAHLPLEQRLIPCVAYAQSSAAPPASSLNPVVRPVAYALKLLKAVVLDAQG